MLSAVAMLKLRRIATCQSSDVPKGQSPEDMINMRTGINGVYESSNLDECFGF